MRRDTYFNFAVIRLQNSAMNIVYVTNIKQTKEVKTSGHCITMAYQISFYRQ